MFTVQRKFTSSWRQVVSDHTRPHAGPFEQLTLDAEAAFEAAAQRLERIDQCRRWLTPGEGSSAAEMLVTLGGLTYQDAALQCLQGGCLRTMVEVSRDAAQRAVREARVTRLYAIAREKNRLLKARAA